jgi:hypothetical protein
MFAQSIVKIDVMMMQLTSRSAVLYVIDSTGWIKYDVDKLFPLSNVVQSIVTINVMMLQSKLWSAVLDAIGSTV